MREPGDRKNRQKLEADAGVEGWKRTKNEAEKAQDEE
jgi:hypothetical protein